MYTLEVIRTISIFQDTRSSTQTEFDRPRDTGLGYLGKAKINPDEYVKWIDILVSDRCICMLKIILFHYYNNIVFTYLIISFNSYNFSLWLLSEGVISIRS